MLSPCLQLSRAPPLSRPLHCLLVLLSLLAVSVSESRRSVALHVDQQAPLSVPIEQPSDSPTSTLRLAVSTTSMVSAALAHCPPPMPFVLRAARSLCCVRATSASLSTAPFVRRLESHCAGCLLHCLSRQSGALAGAGGAASPSPSAASRSPAAVLPSVFLSHGGGPSFFMPSSSSSDRFADIGPDSLACRSLAALSQQLQLTGSRRPRALLVISAHWESNDGSVHITARDSYPSLLYDYYGFPAHTYKLQWPAPGDVQLSHRVHSLLSDSGIAAQLDTERLFDHGVFVPLLVAFPAADIPVVQISLLSSLDAATHLAIGRALAPLRAEGVLIIGSGSITHNFSPTVSPRPFMAALTHLLIEATPAERECALRKWQQIEGATNAHKREEHLIPLLVALGAAKDEKGTELVKHFITNGTWCYANYKVTRHTHHSIARHEPTRNTGTPQ